VTPFFLLAALLNPCVAIAQEKAGEKAGERVDDMAATIAKELEGATPEFFAEYLTETLDEGYPGIVALSGEIRVTYGQFSLEVPDGGVVLWVDPDGWRKFRDAAGDSAAGGEPGEALGVVIRELYAEGNVDLRRGQQYVRAEKMYYNFAQNRALIVNTEVIYRYEDPEKSFRLPLSLKAEKLRQLSEDRFRAENAVVTTSMFAEPAFALQVDRVTLTKEGPSFGIDSAETTFRLSGLPVFWLPFFGGATDFSIEPVQGIILGSSSRYGFVGGVKLGTGIRLSEDDDEPWGKWGAEIVYRSRRGMGGGVDLSYGGDDYWGYLTGYYQRDRQSEDFVTGFPIPSENRGRVRWQHRQVISEDLWGGRLLGIGEFSWLSDAGFLREYYSREALEGKAQEDIGYVYWSGGSHALSLLGKWHANGFQTQTEYLPSLTYDLFSAPVASDILGTGMDVYVAAEGQAARMERKYSDLLDPEPEGVATSRFIGRGSVQTPFSIGALRVSPELGGGVTAWSDRDAAANDPRYDAFASVRLATDLWKVYPDVSSETFDLSGLRHVIDLSATWANRFAVTEPSSAVTVQDPYDLLDEFHALDFRIRNRLETKRAGRIVDFIDFELRALFFPEYTPARPAPFGMREEWEQGMSSVLVPKEEQLRTIARKGWGPIFGDLRARLREDLFFVGDLWYDFETRRFETYSSGVRYEAWPMVSFFVGHRAIQGDSSIITGWVDFSMAKRWSLRFFQQTDLMGDKGLASGITVRRHVHDFVLSATLRHNSLENDTSISFSFEPLFLYDSRRAQEAKEVLRFEEMRWY